MPGALTKVRTWGEMIKFSHSLFAMPFALMGTFLAGRNLPGRHLPRPGQLILIVGCMVLARSVAMTFNRIADYEIDIRNPRTRNRPLQTGRLSLRAALFFCGFCIGGFFACCMGFLWFYRNPWPAIAGAPLLVYLCGYSYSKRFTQWSHFYLGSALALSPVAAWVAIDPASLGWTAVVLMVAVTLWVAGFDIIYACQDIEVDRRDGLYSLPARLGPRAALWIARACHLGTVVLLVALAWVAPLGRLYLAGVACVALLLLVENLLVRADDFSRINVAFFTVNGVVSIGLGVVAVADIWIGIC
jgi:4-hydroxybenzoate polyprenyltransferase